MNAALFARWRCARCSAASAWRSERFQQAQLAALAVPRRYLVIKKHVMRPSPLEGPGRKHYDLKIRALDELLAKGENPVEVMRAIVEGALVAIEKNLREPDYQRIIGVDAQEAKPTFEEFRKTLVDRMQQWSQDPSGDPIYKRLRDARAISRRKLHETLKFWLQHHVTNKRLSARPLLLQRMKELADLRHPFEWFPKTRRTKRKIHLHIGPTNSGKTYHALKRLEKAEKGVYAGPLRLLAREVYQRLNAMGKPCRLKTGDEELDPPGMTAGALVPMMSCTVEMTPLETDFDVAVIDEIQMAADSDRGSAWTMALLGLAAREIHVCGEERSLDLIRNIAQGLGDELEVHRYERLSPLKVQSESLDGSWDRLRKGDCVVGFSVEKLHALRHLIERRSKKKVAIVYGSLPPEIRTQQAALFNDPDSGYDILVASDAIGMGLNLNIQRVIFYTTLKRGEIGMEQIEYPSIKQIAGRAGRFKVAPSIAGFSKSNSEEVKPGKADQDVLPETATRARSLGLVTSLRKEDLKGIQSAMSTTIPPLTHAGIIPTEEIFLQFCSLFPRDTAFSYILLRFYTTARLHPLFRMEMKRNAVRIADTIQAVPNMSNRDRLTFVHAPIGIRDPALGPFAVELARHVSESRPGPILEIPGLKIDLLDREGPATLEYLQELETLHKCLVLYNWLSFRFESIFETRATATQLKSLVEDRIAKSLFEMGAEFQADLKRDFIRNRNRNRRKQLRQMELEVEDPNARAALAEHSDDFANNIIGRTISVKGRPVSGIDTSASMRSKDISIPDGPVQPVTTLISS